MSPKLNSSKGLENMKHCIIRSVHEKYHFYTRQEFYHWWTSVHKIFLLLVCNIFENLMYTIYCIAEFWNECTALPINMIMPCELTCFLNINTNL